MTALEGVTLEIPRGRFLAMYGPNGSGKTTFLRLAAGILEPDSGRIHRAVEEIFYGPTQERQFYERLTGYQNLRFFARLSADPVSGIEEAMLRAGLERDAIHQPVWTYSTGMRIRLSVARALLTRASLLLLDEPTRSIDEEGRAIVLAMIRGLARKGRSIMVATHDPEVLAEAEGRIECRAGRFGAIQYTRGDG